MSYESSLTYNESEYLKHIYTEQVEEGKKLRTIILARSFNVHPSTVTEILQKLANKDFVDYTPYYGAELTEKGVSEAQRLLRKHRVLEYLLVKHLKYDAKKAHGEATKIAHHCSDQLINTICKKYDHPKISPSDKTIFQAECCEIEDPEQSLKWSS